MSGFIAMQREALEHPLLQGGDRFRSFFWLISKACWKPTPFDINGKIVTLQRGQLCVSRSQLASAWGMSQSAVERFLSRLETEQMIGRATGQGRTVITICNYDKYQTPSERSEQATGQASGQRSDSDRTAKEQGNNLTILEEDKSSSLSVDCDTAFDHWNMIAKSTGLSCVEKRTAQRRKAMAARIRENGLDAVLLAIDHIPKSQFLRGEVGDWSGASIKFFLRPDSIVNILEGTYDDRPKRNQQADNRDGVARALDRRLGLDDTPDPFGRRDAIEGPGDSGLTSARIIALR